MSGHCEDLQGPRQGGLKVETQQPSAGGLTSTPQRPPAHFIDEETKAPGEQRSQAQGPGSSPELPPTPNHTAHRVPEIHFYSCKKKFPKNRESM